jgi:hypothetical protein
MSGARNARTPLAGMNNPVAYPSKLSRRSTTWISKPRLPSAAAVAKPAIPAPTTSTRGELCEGTGERSH